MWEIIAGAVLKLIDKFVPDPAQKAAMQLQVLQLRDSADARELEANVRIALAQTDVNKVEAADKSLFKSGWRPAVGWVCVLGLCWTYLAWPALTWAARIRHWPEPPQLDINTMLTLLTGMLGLAGYRTYEKKRGWPDAHRYPVRSCLRHHWLLDDLAP